MTSERYKLVAPEDGWGYAVCVGAVIIFATTTSFIPCFGLMFNDFLRVIEMDSTGLTILNGVHSMSVAIGGFLSSPLLDVMSLRKVTLLGCVSYNCGAFFLIFTHSTLAFYICQAILQGLGIGVLYNLTMTIIKDYFDKKRLLIMSIAHTCTASIAMFIPHLINFGLIEYGYRGMLLLACAVSLQAFAGAMLFQPVSWHMRRVVIKYESESLVEKDNVPAIELADRKADSALADIITQDACKSENIPEEKKVLTKILERLVDMPVLCAMMKSLPLWATALTAFADMMNDLILPQGLYARGWDEGNVAMAISLAGFGDLAARCTFIVCSNVLRKVESQDMFIVGCLVSVAGKIGMLTSSSTTAVLSFITVTGAGRCFFVVISPLVVSDVVGSDNFTMAMGILLVLMGILKLGLGAVIGVIRDYTDSYTVTFYVLTTIIAMCVVPWTIQRIAVKRRIRKKHLNTNNRLI